MGSLRAPHFFVVVSRGGTDDRFLSSVNQPPILWGVRHRSGSLAQAPANRENPSDGGYANPSPERQRAGCDTGVCCRATATPRRRARPRVGPARAHIFVAPG